MMHIPMVTAFWKAEAGITGSGQQLNNLGKPCLKIRKSWENSSKIRPWVQATVQKEKNRKMLEKLNVV